MFMVRFFTLLLAAGAANAAWMGDMRGLVIAPLAIAVLAALHALRVR